MSRQRKMPLKDPAIVGQDVFVTIAGLQRSHSRSQYPPGEYPPTGPLKEWPSTESGSCSGCTFFAGYMFVGKFA